MIYLGTPGRMVGIKCPASQSVEAEDRYTFETTLEGKRKAQMRPLGRRTWNLQTSDATTPADESLLREFSSGAWGPGPFVFVSADAPVTNLLTPPASMCLEMRSNVSSGGPVDLGGGRIAPTSIVAAPVGGVPPEIYFGTGDTPVIPGRQVTGGAYLRGVGATLRIYWYRAGESSPMSNDSSSPVTGNGYQLVSLTAVPPEGAAFCRLVTQRATGVTLPSLTWTSSYFGWAPGEGCQKAVIHAVSKDVIMATNSMNGRYAKLSYTITEVG